MRYERKYRIENQERYVIDHLIMTHPAAFEKAFPDRQVNNVYWDTINWDFASENTSGVSSRSKIRVRWYGKAEDAHIRNPVLEIKSRLNLQGDKKLIPLPDCSWEELTAHAESELQKHFPDKAFQPTLLNSFQRVYYVSMDGRFRLTIDDGIVYGPWLPWRFSTPVEDPGLVVELKYEAPEDGVAEEITRYLGLRMVKNSKYMRGISLVHYTLAF